MCMNIFTNKLKTHILLSFQVCGGKNGILVDICRADRSVSLETADACPAVSSHRTVVFPFLQLSNRQSWPHFFKRSWNLISLLKHVWWLESPVIMWGEVLAVPSSPPWFCNSCHDPWELCRRLESTHGYNFRKDAALCSLLWEIPTS